MSLVCLSRQWDIPEPSLRRYLHRAGIHPARVGIAYALTFDDIIALDEAVQRYRRKRRNG